MRVISGSARGLKLETLDGEHVRPTLDRVKENIFNMISPWIIGAKVIDVCCGSGALGIEALSRGAESCVFDDNFRDSCNVTLRNLKKAKLEHKASVVCVDFEQYFKTTNRVFDIILVDPPYHKGIAEAVAEAVFKAECLNEDGVMVLQFESESELSEVLGFETLKSKRYGKTKVLLLKRKAE